MKKAENFWTGGVHEVRQFLGFANYYRRFVQNYARIAVPLTDLTKQELVFQWSTKCQNAFNQLKGGLLSAPILRLADMSKPFRVGLCDWCRFAARIQAPLAPSRIRQPKVATSGTQLPPLRTRALGSHICVKTMAALLIRPRFRSIHQP